MKKKENSRHRFLLLEDSKGDQKLIERKLGKAGYDFELLAVDNRKEFIKAIRTFNPDLVLSDENVPSFRGSDALQWCTKNKFRKPFIVVTGTLGEEQAVEFLKNGAADFVLKTNLDRLPFSVKRALKEYKEEKRAEDAAASLRYSENHLRSVLENTPVGIIELDPTGIVLNSNGAGFRIFGTKEKALLNRKYQLLGGESDEKKIEEAIRLSLKGETRTIIHGLKRDSKAIAESIFVPLKQKRGKPDSVLVLVSDITEKKLADEKVRMGEALLREAESVAHIGSWEYFPDNDSMHWSIETYRIFGLPDVNEEINFKKFVDLCYPEDRNMVVWAIQSALSENESIGLDHRIMFWDNSVKWVHSRGRPSINKEGQATKILGTIQDITERKMFEKRLSRSSEMLKKAQSMAQLGSFQWNIKLDILEYSEELLKILEIDEDETLISFNALTDFIHNADLSFLSSRFQQALETGQDYTFEYRAMINDKIKYLRSEGHFVKDRNNEPQHLIGTIQDITSRKMGEEALIRGQEIERKRMAQEIHDGIGQMLVAINFNLGALESESKEEIQKQLPMIQSILRDTIEETRRITKNLSTRILEEFGLEKALKDLCEEAGKVSGIKFESDFKLSGENMSDGVTTVVYRVTQEAINNAIKYSSATQCEVNLMTDENQLLLRIGDDGKGYDTNSPNFVSGNGLSNMKERVKSVNGFFIIESTPGNGTTINVEIPL